MSKIKILHILWHGRSGGAERFVQDIVLFTDRSRFDHQVCFMSFGGWMADAIAESGIPVYYLGMNTGRSLLSALRFFRLMRSVNPDIVMVHSRNFLISLFLLFSPLSIKVFFEHGVTFEGMRALYTKIYYNLLIIRFAVVLANSENSRELLLKNTHLTAEKVKLFYIGIDLEKYGRIPLERRSKLRRDLSIMDGCLVVGGVGRLFVYKGFDDFIRIAKAIVNVRNNMQFLIVGDGPERQRLERLAAELNVSVKFLGDRQDVHELLNVMDVFLFSGRFESFGIVLLEALAVGVPIVSFKIPGPMEVIKKCGGGILISPGSLDAISAAVVDLLDNPEKRQKLVEEGYANVRKYFNVRNRIAELESIYEFLIKKKGHA